ncbi:hypothetical protein [Pseudomonas fragi]|uniref:hypothetical protein n=1 Tax=Pseudomonas fragi TaxID=296 RepID=UPI00117993D5|nr:hypothetical protein [Pseudomonas fragi]
MKVAMPVSQAYSKTDALPVKPPVRKERRKSGSGFIWPIQKDSVPVSSSAHANSEPVSDAADTTVLAEAVANAFRINMSYERTGVS